MRPYVPVYLAIYSPILGELSSKNCFPIFSICATPTSHTDTILLN